MGVMGYIWLVYVALEYTYFSDLFVLCCLWFRVKGTKIPVGCNKALLHKPNRAILFKAVPRTKMGRKGEQRSKREVRQYPGGNFFISLLHYKQAAACLQMWIQCADTWVTSGNPASVSICTKQLQGLYKFVVQQGSSSFLLKSTRVWIKGFK